MTCRAPILMLVCVLLFGQQSTLLHSVGHLDIHSHDHSDQLDTQTIQFSTRGTDKVSEISRRLLAFTKNTTLLSAHPVLIAQVDQAHANNEIEQCLIFHFYGCQYIRSSTILEPKHLGFRSILLEYPVWNVSLPISHNDYFIRGPPSEA